MKQVPQLVEFKPDPKRTNGLIGLYNAKIGAGIPAAEMASEFCSTLAAIVYMIRTTNHSAKTRELVGACVEDAIQHYEAREKKIKGETSEGETVN